MMHRLAEWIVYKCIEKADIAKYGADAYAYGIEKTLVYLCGLLDVIIVGLILGMVWESLLFLILFLPLRSFAGGYHASSYTKCGILSNCILIAVLCGLKFNTLSVLADSLLAVAAGLIIYRFAPAQHKNRPLDEDEYKRGWYIARIVAFIYLGVLGFGTYYNWYVSKIIVYVLTLSAVLVLIQTIINKKENSSGAV